MDQSYGIVCDLDEQIEINFKSGESWSLHAAPLRPPDEEETLNDLDLEFSGNDIIIPPPPNLEG